MRFRSATFNALLLAVDLALSAAAAAGTAFLVSPGLPWLLVFALLWGSYLAFTGYCLTKGVPVVLQRLKAFPLDLALHPAVAGALREAAGGAAAFRPALLRTSSLTVNALSLGREERGCLVLTDGALQGLGPGEMRALLARERARLQNGDAAIWSLYARLTLAPTVFARLTGRRGYDTANPALNRAFFLVNLVLFAVFWLGLLLAADGSGAYRILLAVGMPSCMAVMTLLTNLLVSVALFELLRTVAWRERELAADAAAAALPGGGEDLASVFARAAVPLPEAGTAAFDRSVWVGPIRLRKAYFVNYEAYYQLGGWNPQPSLQERGARLRSPVTSR